MVKLRRKVQAFPAGGLKGAQAAQEGRGQVPRPFWKQPAEMFSLRVSSSCAMCLGSISGHRGGISSCLGGARFADLRARLSGSSRMCLPGSVVLEAPGSGVSVGMRAAR